MNNRYRDYEGGEIFEHVEEEPKYFGDAPPSTKTAIEKADKEGLTVVYPTNQQLQIDIDSAEAYQKFQEHFKILFVWLQVTQMVKTPSVSGEAGHFHITITSERYFNIFERLALQAFLGSDLKRELLGFVMYKNGESKPTLFLEKKDQ